MSLHPSTIATQNDEFRSGIHIPQFGVPKIPGRLLITQGVAALPPVSQIEIIAEVRDFDAFTEDNDPYSGHDFGSFDHPTAGKILWKIDYYNADLTGGSPDPADTSVTCRVLTIMRALEY